MGVILGAVVAAHAAGLTLRRKTGWPARLGEVFSLLGSIMFGAGIWLVAQVYHIEEHFPNGFLIWGLGALAMAWALDSVLQGLLAVVTLTIWGCSESAGFHHSLDWSPLLLAVGVAPLVWRHKSRVLLGVLLTSFYLLLLFNADNWCGGAGAYTTAFALSALLVAAAKIETDDGSPNFGAGMLRGFGLVGFLTCSYLLGFHGLVSDLLRWSQERWADSAAMIVAYRWGLFAAAAAAWAWLAWRAARGARALVTREEWLVPIALLYCQGLAVTGYYVDAQFVAIVFNLVLLGVATMWMVRGCREGVLQTTVFGSLLLAVVVFARYFDLFDNLAARGLTFILLGGVLFAEGFYYRLRRRDEAADRSDP